MSGYAWMATSAVLLAFMAFFVCTFYALGAADLSLGDASTLVSLSPVFLAALAPFALGERTAWLVIVALLLALVGVVLILQSARTEGQHREERSHDT